MKKTFEDAWVGMEVWAPSYFKGVGIITRINKKLTYPISVECDDREYSFSLDGKYLVSHEGPALFT